MFDEGDGGDGDDVKLGLHMQVGKLYEAIPANAMSHVVTNVALLLLLLPQS